MTTPDHVTDPGMPVPRGRRAARVVVMCLVIAAIVLLAATSWAHG
jgi:hypothetical protein